MRIVLITSEPVFALGVRAMLESTGDLVLAATCNNARSGVQTADQEEPEVVLVDLTMSGGSALEATREIVRLKPTSKVLLLSVAPTARELQTAVAAGAQGLVNRSDSEESLCTAIREVGRGQRHFPVGLETFLPRAESRGQIDVLGALSPRERQIVTLIVEGMSSRDVGKQLCISIKTVETHRSHINKKLGCKSPAALIRFAARNGLLEEPRLMPGLEGPLSVPEPRSEAA
jgi:DNA-binding NarL/FixJ family response regulator